MRILAEHDLVPAWHRCPVRSVRRMLLRGVPVDLWLLLGGGVVVAMLLRLALHGIRLDGRTLGPGVLGMERAQVHRRNVGSQTGWRCRCPSAPALRPRMVQIQTARLPRQVSCRRLPAWRPWWHGRMRPRPVRYRLRCGPRSHWSSASPVRWKVPRFPTHSMLAWSVRCAPNAPNHLAGRRMRGGPRRGRSEFPHRRTRRL